MNFLAYIERRYVKMFFADITIPRISFIVPVYNAENYLYECLESIVQQLDGNELILIDDGSTDSSGSICDRYKAEYAAVKVLHTQNKGVSHARNLGVDLAQGEYIVFVDSDDFINADFVQKYVQLNTTADIVFFPMRKLLRDGSTILMNDGISANALRDKNAQDVLSHISNCPKFPASPCGRLVRLNFLKKHQICFAFNRISEDYDWTYQLLQHAESFDFFSGGLYTYRQTPQSRSAIGASKAVEDQLVILTSWEKRNVPNTFRQPLNVFLSYEYAMILPYYGALPKKEKNIYRTEIRRCAYLLHYGKSRKLKCIRLVTKMLGVDLTAQVLYVYINWRNKRYGKQ